MPKKGAPLDVWLYGVRTARLTETSAFRYRLAFTEEALDTFGQDARVLSLSLPISSEPVEDAGAGKWPVHAFLEGLLPEGNLLRQVASTARVPVTDKMSLLSQVGADCAGAVQILPIGKAPGDGHVRPLTKEEVDRLVADLPTYHLPDGAYPQASLAGIQDKVLLRRLEDGSWGWPENGAASSHIVKPEPTGYVLPHLLQAEDWALHVATEAGLRAAESRVEVFGGRKALVVSRYDRRPDGSRLHQEDFCQALGLAVDAKYESTVEDRRRQSRLSRLVAVAAPRAADPNAFRSALLSQVTYNVVIGNGDAHSKNYSVLIGERGQIELAPLYDAAPVMHLNPAFASTGHVINGRTNIGEVSVDDLADEATRWGMSPRRAKETVRTAMERTWQAVQDTPGPEGADDVRVRLAELWKRRSWSVG